MVAKRYDTTLWLVVFVIWNQKERTAVLSTNRQKIEEYARNLADPSKDAEPKPLQISSIYRLTAGKNRGPTKVSLMDAFPNLFPWRLKEKNKIENLDKN